MRFTRILALFALVIACLIIPAYAQDDQFGMIKGVVKMEDGLPCPGIAVSVKIGEKDLKYTSGADGAFTGVLPAGKAVVSVTGATQTVEILPGEATAVELVIKQTGVIISVTNPDKTPAMVNDVSVAYKSPGGEKQGIQGVRLSQGVFWLRDIPSDATALSAMVQTSQLRYNGAYRQQWAFEKPETLRKLAMTIGVPGKVEILLLDADANPMPDAQAQVTVTYQNAPVRPWDAPERYTPNTTTQTIKQRTDAVGMLDLGMWAPRQYEISIRSDEKAGAITPLTITEDGTVSLIKYALNLQPRTVTQTVFSADGKPVPNTEVFAGYVRQGKVIFDRAVSNAAGVVAWKEMPPVRVIVWGQGIPVGMLPPDAVTVTTPLSPPVTNNNERYRNIRFTVTNPGDKPVRVYTFWRSGDSGTNTGEMELRPENTEGRRMEYSMRPGQPFTFLMVTRTTPPRIFMLSNVYAPFTDSEEPVEITCTLTDGVGLHGRFVTAGGKPVPGVSQLQVLPLKGDVISSLLADGQSRSMNILTPVENLDGSFDVSLPSPGKYRLVVDAFDTNTIPLPALVIEVKQGMNDVTVTLPEPLATVTPGTEVCWISKFTPGDTRRLVAPAIASAVPVFGPKEQILALWYRAAPNKLILQTPADPAKPQQTLTLRSAYLNPQDSNGNPISYSATLLPMLPVSMGGRYYDSNASTRGRAEAMRTSLLQGTMTRTDLWPGTYALESGVATVEIPAEGDPRIAVAIERTSRTVRERNETRQVGLKFPKADYDALRKSAANQITPIYDDNILSRDGSRIGTWDFGRNNDTWISVPVDAKTITLNWLGVGSISNVALPLGNPEGEAPILTLPDWTPGVTVTGKVLAADGKPYANGGLNISVPTYSSYEGNSYRVNTDAAGAFTLKGMAVGTLFIFQERDNNSGWALEVPEKGLSDLTLRINTNPMRISSSFGSSRSAHWWITSDGKATRLPARWSECVVNDPPTGTGWLWQVDNESGRARYLPFTPAPGRQENRQESTGPALGITFPFVAGQGLPRAVTLVGLKERTGLQAYFPNFQWQATPMLGLVVGQIAAVPPGTYQLTVDTPAGKVEKTVEVTEYGGSVALDYPTAP